MSLGKIFFYSSSTSGGDYCLTFICRWIKDLSSRDSWASTEVKT